ncbi:hypothetical protein A9Q89_03620 [Gammaproteobacteria bacterium 53_120_T64]|nr:hypothetical protein A9Q89_03620 [Gammaproteobacteria bacterium 53_120_T64]
MLFRLFSASLIVLSLSACSGMQSAGTGRNILVVVDSQGRLSPAAEKLGRGVADEVSGQLNSAGHRVFDRSVLAESADLQGKRLNKQAWIDLARHNGRSSAIDTLALIEVSVVRKQIGDYSTELQPRARGQLLDVNSGKSLGQVSLAGQIPPLRVRPDCDRRCSENKLLDQASVLAQPLGAQLSALLEAVNMKDSDELMASVDRAFIGPPAHAVSLKLDNVSADELAQMEHYLAEVFSGYRSHEWIHSTGLSHDLRYETELSDARLLGNLRRAMSELNWHGEAYLDGAVLLVRKLAVRVPFDQLTERPATKSDFHSW